MAVLGKAEITISDIQVGGRNLLLDTRSMGVKAWYTGRYGLISDRISKNGVVTVPAGSANFSMHLIDCKPNEDFVFSVDAKSKTTPFENAWCAILAYYNIAEDGKLTRIGYDKVIGDLTTEWQRFSKHIKVPNDPKIHVISIGFRAYFDSESNTPPSLPEDIEVKLPKMERGNTPTDWSPAPEDVDNITTGGRNLATGTSDMVIGTGGRDKGHWCKTGTGTIATVSISDCPVAGIKKGIRLTTTDTTNMIGLAQDQNDCTLIAGKIYTMSCWVKASVADVQIDMQPFYISVNDKSGSLSIMSTGEWQYLEFTSSPAKNTRKYSTAYVYWAVKGAAVGTTLDVCAIKLEEGTAATSWSPAPEDVEADIDELRAEYKSELKIEQDRITANVEATDALGSRVSKVEQTADGLEVSLSNLKFGGRNLLLKTGELLGSNFWADTSGSEAIGKVASQSDGSILITNTNTNTRIVTNPIDVSLNTDYMISIDYKLVSGSHPFQIQTTEYEEDGKTAVMYGAITSDKYTSTPIGGGWYRIVAPYRTSNNQKTKKFRPWFRTGLDYENYTCQYYIRRPKMEIGNVATDWTPAPEDVLDAPKTATNFLSYDSSNGLQIGNKSSGSWTGTRARIKPSAFEIIDSAGAVLASYAANRIDLGKNSINSVVGLCGGKATMSYSTSNGGFMIESTDIILRSTATFNILNGGSSLRVDDISTLMVGDSSTGQQSFVTMGKDYMTLRTYKNNGTGTTLELKQAGTINASVVGNGFLINGYGPLLGNYINGYYGMMRPDRNHADWIRTTQQGIIPYQNGGASSLGTSSWPFANIHANNIHANNIYDNGTLLENKFLNIRGFINTSNLNSITAPGVWGINGINITIQMYDSIGDGSLSTYTWTVWGTLIVSPYFTFQALMCGDPRNGRPNIFVRHLVGSPASWSYWTSLGN